MVGSSSFPGGRYLIRGCYVDIEDATRDLIAQYVWRRQKPLLGQDDGEN